MKRKKFQIEKEINTKIIIDFMKERNMNIKQLARECNVSVYILDKILKGYTKPSFSVLYNLANFIKVSLDDLIIVKSISPQL